VWNCNQEGTDSFVIFISVFRMVAFQEILPPRLQSSNFILYVWPVS